MLFAPALSAVMVKTKLTLVGVPSTTSGLAAPSMKTSVVAAWRLPPTFDQRWVELAVYDIVTFAPVEVSRLETTTTSAVVRGPGEVTLLDIVGWPPPVAVEASGAGPVARQ